jgi:hypothetical protein
VASLGYDDDELLDHALKAQGSPSLPEYPPGCTFSVSHADLERAGLADYAPGDICRFSAMGVVTSVYHGREDCRIELELTQFAGPDGQFADLENPSHISLCDAELDKMDLDDDCERGDTIHLIGKVRVESTFDHEYAGHTCVLQITDLDFEDESAEARG